MRSLQLPGSAIVRFRFPERTGISRVRMAQHAEDFRAEGHDLNALIKNLSEEDWSRPTPFKERTVNWLIKHLHEADRWAYKSITDPDGFRAWIKLPPSM